MKKFVILAGIGLIIREIASEANAMFETIFAGGNKEELAKCANLSNEEKIVREDNINEREKRIKWKNKSRNTECYVKGCNDTPLYCKVYIQKSKSKKWVVVVHGYGGWGSTLDYATKTFYEKGYNVVVPDLRGHGKSGGRYIGMGNLDSRDIINIIHLIIRGDSKSEIYLYGVSMGGATVLMAVFRETSVKC